MTTPAAPPSDVWVWSPPEPGPPDLIPGLLPRHGHLLISGETDVGKTTIALEIAMAVLTGLPLWESPVRASQTIQRVTYIMGEHHESILQSLWRLMDFGGEPAIKIIPPHLHRPLVVRGVTMERTIEAYVGSCQGSQLLIFDPLNAFVAGTDAENDSVPMRACLNGMESIATQVGAALLVLGHMGKPRFDQKRQKYEHRTTYASRGSSAIEDAATCCYYMVADDRDASLFRLIRRKYKGEAPTFYGLRRDTRNRHHLISGGKTRTQVSTMRSEAGKQGGRPKTECD